jgi:hypothetical protein
MQWTGNKSEDIFEILISMLFDLGILPLNIKTK